MSAEKPQPTQQDPPKLSVDEQVSLLLAHFNRANNSVAKEAESALIKVVSQVMEIQKKYFELSEEYTKYKAEYGPKDVKQKESKISPPTNSK
jgi:hypothetical protein